MVEHQSYRCVVCGRVWPRVVKVTQAGTVIARVVNIGACNRCGGRLEPVSGMVSEALAEQAQEALKGPR